ncbi:MAG: type IX secretion system membrane protein PorP/SprF [Bacteroidetes bacterium]|nr:type IX secretion system membrane protein PorP/SprF [Bacteroidota bacterium]
MNTKLKIVIASVIAIVSCGYSWGQQEPHFAQYFDNTLYVNPAYAGSKGVMNAMLLHREQWVGVDGRPRSTTFSFQSPLPYESVGVGVTAVNDVIGPLTQTMIYADFSYSLRFQNKSRLAFGVKAGMNMINNATSTLKTTQEADPSFLQSTYFRTNPNFGFGVYYYSRYWFIGASVPKLLEQSYSNIDRSMLEKRHYFGIAGLVLDLSSNWKLRPTGQFKYAFGAPYSVDMSVAGIYNDRFYIGGSYRLDAAFGAFVQYQINAQFKIGLASEFGTQAVRKYNDGTFEAMLSYDFDYRKKGIRSPRYF